jgi:hypothetical protein
MIIPIKYSGYQAGIRVYPNEGDSYAAPVVSAPVTTTTATTTPAYNPNSATPWTGLGVNTQAGYNTLMQAQGPNVTAQQKGNIYNTLLGQGFNDQQIRSSANTVFGNQSDSDWNQLVQYAGQQAPGNRPMPGSAQFYQPVYQPQYQNYNTGNNMNVSQYGQQPSGGIPQMQTPFSMFGGQMQGGGYGQYGSNNPYSPYSNSFLNMDQNLSQGSMADKANMYRNAIQNRFTDQQIYNQAGGLFGQQSPQAWGWLQGAAMGMTPGLQNGTMQDKANFYNQARGQGFNDQIIRNAANNMIGQQSQGDWNQLQNQAARSSGPQQPIYSRSAGMRGTPVVRNYAKGGIANLVGKK